MNDLYDWRARDGGRAVGPGDELLEVQHQSLVACLLTATDAASPAWSAYLGRDGGAVVETLAASGAQVLAASALDGYLDLARDWWDDAPATWVRAAIDSVHALAGTWIDEWEEDADVDAWADEARAAVAAAGTPYVHRGDRCRQRRWGARPSRGSRAPWRPGDPPPWSSWRTSAPGAA